MVSMRDNRNVGGQGWVRVTNHQAEKRPETGAVSLIRF